MNADRKPTTILITGWDKEGRDPDVERELAKLERFERREAIGCLAYVLAMSAALAFFVYQAIFG